MHPWSAIQSVLGLDTSLSMLAWWQVVMRAVVIYIGGLLIVRVGYKRFLGRSTAFDAILGFILGTTLSRAINTGAPFIGTLVGGLTLVLVHVAFAHAACSSRLFSRMVKGRTSVLIDDGRLDARSMLRHGITIEDLHEELRLQRGIDDLQRVDLATLERSGELSFCSQDGKRVPRVVEVNVEKGVQTVRLVIS